MALNFIMQKIYDRDAITVKGVSKMSSFAFQNVYHKIKYIYTKNLLIIFL